MSCGTFLATRTEPAGRSSRTSQLLSRMPILHIDSTYTTDTRHTHSFRNLRKGRRFYRRLGGSRTMQTQHIPWQFEGTNMCCVPRVRTCIHWCIRTCAILCLCAFRAHQRLSRPVQWRENETCGWDSPAWNPAVCRCADVRVSHL